MSDDGWTTVTLSDTLVSLKLALGLLSVLVLVKKKIPVLYIPELALLIDVEDDLQILGRAHQDRDYPLYIENQRGD